MVINQTSKDSYVSKWFRQLGWIDVLFNYDGDVLWFKDFEMNGVKRAVTIEKTGFMLIFNKCLDDIRHMFDSADDRYTLIDDYRNHFSPNYYSNNSTDKINWFVDGLGLCLNDAMEILNVSNMIDIQFREKKIKRAF